MDKNKVEIRNLYLIFGSEKNKAFRMLKKGKSKNEILKETGCTIAVNNASLSVREGEIFVIMGLSGSGKSSLLRCINRLNRPTSGEILINGEDIAGIRSGSPADGRGLLSAGPADTGTDAGRAAGLAVKDEKDHRIYHTRLGGGCQVG